MSSFSRNSGLRCSGFKKSTASAVSSRVTSPVMKTTMEKRNDDDRPVFYPPPIQGNMTTGSTETASEKGNVGEPVAINKILASRDGRLHSGNWPTKVDESKSNQSSTTSYVQANLPPLPKTNQIIGINADSPMYGEEITRVRARETNSIYANARHLKEIVKNNGAQETESSLSRRFNAAAFSISSQAHLLSVAQPVNQEVESKKPSFQEKHQGVKSPNMEPFGVEKPPPDSPSVMVGIRAMHREAGGPVVDCDETLLQLHVELRKARRFREIMSSVQRDPVIRDLFQAVSNTIKKLAGLNDDDHEILNQWLSIS